jgi:phosphoglucomutase
MPTSTAVDRVADSLRVRCYETPTGWKFFGNLMDAGLCTLCGEESFGTGSDHVREKDGLWAVLCWLSILASTGIGVRECVESHWTRFGRSYYQRHDYEELEAAAAAAMIERVRERLAGLRGTALAGSTVTTADEFAYTDPVDGSRSERQGIRLLLADRSRVVFRLSGTGTQGATLRVYLERFLPDGSAPIETVLEPLVRAAADLLDLRRATGRDRPDVIT